MFLCFLHKNVFFENRKPENDLAGKKSKGAALFAFIYPCLNRYNDDVVFD